ncbi:hypothetical protein [Cryobacterium algoritolerans]|uniref:hypothetical protein n=1 Tax=Cryobacterium algoritolerans TaxID=1259184 RepID=UPI001580E41F|nr:hypothetical protein [Cryobacterium algoritolerans]
MTAFLLAGPVASFILANTPPPEFNPDTVTPGPAGFVAIFFIAAMVVLLGFDLNRRIRRNTYRAQIKERLAAEIAANAAGDADDPASPGQQTPGQQTPGQQTGQ